MSSVFPLLFVVVIQWTINILTVVALTVLTAVYLYKIIFEFRIGKCMCKTRMDGKTVLVTGGNSGIGLETARDLARRGARVIIASRNEEMNKTAVQDITNTTGNHNVSYKSLNLGNLDNVKKFAKDLKQSEQRLDVIVCNAGAICIKPIKTKDRIDLVMQINYIGHFLLVHSLINLLNACTPARIVVVSSVAHMFHYFDKNNLAGNPNTFQYIRYCNSKLCNVLWTRALAKKLPQGITANSLHPGLVTTNIFRNTPLWVELFLKSIFKLFLKNTVQGAQTTIHLCVAPELQNSSGGYYVDCKLSKPSSLAYDDELVEKVWNDSLELTKKYL